MGMPGFRLVVMRHRNGLNFTKMALLCMTIMKLGARAALELAPAAEQLAGKGD